jgi:hypothetical protein
MKRSKTYEECGFKIGQKIVCLNLGDNPEFWDQHLTIGKTYKIIDLEIHFADSVCVKNDSGNGMFFSCEFFVGKNFERKLKLQKLKKIDGNNL